MGLVIFHIQKILTGGGHKSELAGMDGVNCLAVWAFKQSCWGDQVEQGEGVVLPLSNKAEGIPC